MTLEAATPEGVEEEKQEPIANPRNDFIADLAKKTREERDEEIKASGEAPVDTAAAEEVPQVEDTQPEESPKAEEAPAEEKPAEQAEELVAIKVDGKIQHVPKDKIYEAGLRAVQKESAADKRLEEATRLLAEAQQRYAQPQQNSPPSQAWDEATIAYALEHGNDEQKVEAVRQLRGREQTATPAQIAEYATTTVLDKVDFQNAAEWFQSEYKDVVGDPYLLQLAAAKEVQMRNSGDERPRRALYKDIGDELRKWRGGSVAAPSLDQKREQKASVTNLPSASVRKAAPPEQKAKTPSDIIEDMRKRRGQSA